jgi:hypothetical protein
MCNNLLTILGENHATANKDYLRGFANCGGIDISLGCLILHLSFGLRADKSSKEFAFL